MKTTPAIASAIGRLGSIPAWRVSENTGSGILLYQWKGDTHDTLSMVFKRDGVPPKMVVDNSKEQSLGEFARKCLEVDCHLINNEPYSCWCMSFLATLLAQQGEGQTAGQASNTDTLHVDAGRIGPLGWSKGAF